MAVFTESFEGVAVTANSPLYAGNHHFVQPGFSSSFVFASGLRLLQPFPNNQAGANYALVGDFARLNSSLSLGTNGGITAADVPTGTGYIFSFDASEFSFAFDTAVYSVGAYVDSVGGTSPGMVAYSATGAVISGARIRSVPVADWDTNYIQVLSKVPIAKVVFTSGYVVVDDLTFDTKKPKIVNGTNNDDQLNASGLDAAGPSNKGELIFGKNGDDKIKAKAGDDTIDGGKGNDKVKGGDGNDTLIVGKGDDKARGDLGQDTFQFNKLGAVTVLKDFTVADDTILLERSTFLAIPLGPLPAGRLQIGVAALDANDRLIYNPTTGELSYDADGSDPAAAIVFAKLPVGLALTAADFLVA